MNGTQPTEDDASFDKWDSENSTVISWLLRSMQPEISNGCIFLETTKDIWETVSFKVSPRIFGSVCFICVYAHARSKLEPKALKCIFVGYPSSQEGYKCYHLFYVYGCDSFLVNPISSISDFFSEENKMEEKFDSFPAVFPIIPSFGGDV